MNKIAFGALVLLVVCLAVATFIEARLGAQYVSECVYGSFWFIGLWAVTAVTTLLWLIRQKTYRKPAVFLLHLSLLVILAGAFLTYSTGVRGYMHLREGVAENMFNARDGGYLLPMPFSLALDSFEIAFYPGTDAPADYISHLDVMRYGETVRRELVSMNNILSVDGFRFYQTSYDPDGKGSVLSVNYDPWGIPVTYTGYILLGISILCLLLSPRGSFRKLLRHPLLKIVPVLLVPGQLSAQARTVGTSEAEKLGNISVMYNGRIAPLQTLAHDLTLKLTDGKGYEGYSPVQILAGCVFFPEDWQQEPFIRIKDKLLRETLGTGEYVSLSAFFNDRNEYLLATLNTGIYDRDRQSALLKAIYETDEKVQILRMLQQGSLLTVFPNEENGQLKWYSPSDDLPEGMGETEKLLIRDLFGLLKTYVSENDWENFAYTVDKFRIYQNRKAGEHALSECEIRCEKFYNNLALIEILYKINLVSGLVMFLLSGLVIIIPGNRRINNFVTISRRVARIMLWCVLIALTAYMGLRTYVSGRIPLSNGYETMVFVSWMIVMIATLFNHKFRLLIPFGLLLSGFTLLVASLGQMNPQITPLMPVLLSPWLSVHVSVIMVAYALCAFIMLNGVTALILRALNKGGGEMQVKLMLVSRIFLYPAVLLLGAGIFIGAVWANVSWGRYWAWDPKEVWALICFLIYGLAFHLQSIPLFRRPLFFHVFMVVAFLSLLMTYFGVNSLLGGMHSYN